MYLIEGSSTMSDGDLIYPWQGAHSSTTAIIIEYLARDLTHLGTAGMKYTELLCWSTQRY